MLGYLYKSIITAFLMLTLAGCSLSTIKTQVSQSDGVDTKDAKVIIFPVFLKGSNFEQINKDFDIKTVDASLARSWKARSSSGDFFVVTSQMMDKMPGAWKVAETLVNNIDKTNQMIGKGDGEISKFLKSLASQAGDGALALAIVFEDESAYESSQTIHFNMGLFDTQELKFSWVSNTVSTKNLPLPIPYEVALENAISDAWGTLDKQLAKDAE